MLSTTIPIRPASFPRTRTASAALAAMLLAGALAGCGQPREPGEGEPAPATDASAAQAPDTVSILRPDVEPPVIEERPAPLAPYKAVIGFPDGGTRIDADAQAALENLLASEQLALGLPITLRAHSDSAGSDKANLDSSEKRGLAVAQWLIERGVSADRITVIAFGEQNPLEPNARPDGSPNEEGRAANRRVEVEVPGAVAMASEPARNPKPGPAKAPAKENSAQSGD